jgi:putative DNA primase/helicase
VITTPSNTTAPAGVVSPSGKPFAQICAPPRERISRINVEDSEVSDMDGKEANGPRGARAVCEPNTTTNAHPSAQHAEHATLDGSIAQTRAQPGNIADDGAAPIGAESAAQRQHENDEYFTALYAPSLREIDALLAACEKDAWRLPCSCGDDDCDYCYRHDFDDWLRELHPSLVGVEPLRVLIGLEDGDPDALNQVLDYLFASHVRHVREKMREVCVGWQDDEFALARGVVDLLDGQALYVPALGGWLTRDGRRWRRDDRMSPYAAARRAISIATRYQGLTASPAARARLRSAGTVASITRLASADSRLIRTPADFDRHRFELNTPDGVVDLRTGTIRNRARDELFLHSTAVVPDESVPTEFLRFLDSVFRRDTPEATAEVVGFMQRLLGYCLTGEVSEQVFAFLYGVGANGKSTLLDAIAYAMGDYAIRCPGEMLMLSRGDRHPTEIAQLAGVRLAIANEVSEGAVWDEAKIKMLTGDATLRARLMRQDFFEFPVTHKIVIAANYRPILRVVDPAFARRFLLIDFRHRFDGKERDYGLAAKLRDEAAGILRWLIVGAASWHRESLRPPAEVALARQSYLEDMDSIGAWFAECCRLEQHRVPGDPSSWLYQSYRRFAIARGYELFSQRRLTALLEARGLERVRGGKARAFRGVNLLEGERTAIEVAIAPSQRKGSAASDNRRKV